MRPPSPFESLEARRLLSGTAQLSDPSMGMSNWSVPTAQDLGEVVLPQVSADGTIEVYGTDFDDVITLDRVADPGLDRDDGEADVAKYLDGNGGPVWSSGNFFDVYMPGPEIDGEYVERDALLAQAADARAAGNESNAQFLEGRAAEYQGHIDQSEEFLSKFTSGKFLRITMQGVYDYFYEMTDEQAADARFYVEAGAGSDVVTVSKNVPLKASIDGGSGPDVLTGGMRKPTLRGGGGKDRIISRSPRGGTLDGGKWADTYYFVNAGDAVKINARADGDRVSTGRRLITVTAPGQFLAATLSSVASTKPTSKRYAASGLVDDAG